ncbi:hypothetical protein IBE76_10405, partial [Francisella tularensis]|uniref:hypothetical protein n=1 Tax=Francisella tularensis TaxID=263 RepID=UPI001C0EE696|nr:hypothetical protein [Francisella tularensis]
IFRIVLPLLSGAILTLAFAPFRIDILALISLILFFYQLNKATAADKPAAIDSVNKCMLIYTHDMLVPKKPIPNNVAVKNAL